MICIRETLAILTNKYPKVNWLNIVEAHILFVLQVHESDADRQGALLHSGTHAPSIWMLAISEGLVITCIQSVKDMERAHLLFKSHSLEVAHSTSTNTTKVTSSKIWKLLIELFYH